MGKDDINYLRQESNSKVLDLVKQKGVCPYKYISDFKKFKQELPSK